MSVVTIPNKAAKICCSVCAEDIPISKIITCVSCGFECCVADTQTYLLSSTLRAHCMSCKRAWDPAFMDKSFAKTWVTTVYRNHLKKILVDRERAMLADAIAKIPQILEEKRLNTIIKNFTARRSEIKKFWRKINSEMDALHNLKREKWYQLRELKQPVDQKVVKDIESEISRYTTASAELYLQKTATYPEKNELDELIFNARMNLARFQGTLENPSVNMEKANFICPCPHTDQSDNERCRGLITNKYTCNVCEKKICSQCRAPKLETEKHACVDDDIKTVELLKKDTKPCPGCAIGINRSSGCDQMWCVSCHTLFNWTTGKIETGVVHNPYAVQWQRNNGTLRRDINDIPCGGIPDLWVIDDTMREILRSKFDRPSYRVVEQLHLFMAELQYKLDQNVVNNNFEPLRLSYVMKQITEKQWIQRIFLQERSNERKQLVTDVITTLRLLLVEHFRDLMLDFEERRSRVLAEITTQLDSFLKVEMASEEYLGMESDDYLDLELRARDYILKYLKNKNVLTYSRLVLDITQKYTNCPDTIELEKAHGKEFDDAIVKFVNKLETIRQFCNEAFEGLRILGSTKVYHIKAVPNWNNAPEAINTSTLIWEWVKVDTKGTMVKIPINNHDYGDDEY